MERYAYLQDGKNEFNSTDILCVVADAIHVGSEDWLNIMVYNHTKGKVWICPPQAGFFFCKQKQFVVLRGRGALLPPGPQAPEVRVALPFLGPGGAFFVPPGSGREVRLSPPKFPGTCIPASGPFSGSVFFVVYTNPKYAYPRLGPALGDGLRKAPICLLLLFRPREVRAALPKFPGHGRGPFSAKSGPNWSPKTGTPIPA